MIERAVGTPVDARLAHVADELAVALGVHHDVAHDLGRRRDQRHHGHLPLEAFVVGLDERQIARAQQRRHRGHLLARQRAQLRMHRIVHGDRRPRRQQQPERQHEVDSTHVRRRCLC
jgi:hypothetical protein